MKNQKLQTRAGHVKFFIEKELLYEYYQKGDDFHKILITEVPGMKDQSICNSHDIKRIEMIYLNKFNLEGRYQFYLQMIGCKEENFPLVQKIEMRRTFFAACGIFVDLFKNEISELSEEEGVEALLSVEQQVKNFFIGQGNNFN